MVKAELRSVFIAYRTVSRASAKYRMEIMNKNDDDDNTDIIFH